MAPAALAPVGPGSGHLPIALTRLTTPFNDHSGIVHHESTRRVVVSSHYPSGEPYNLESLNTEGTHRRFSSLAGLGGRLRLATARDDGRGKSRGGFEPGDLFTGTDVPGVLARIAPDGSAVQNPWVGLPGESGLLDGGLSIDRSGLFGGDLIVVTTQGSVWRVSSSAVPNRLANLGAHLEGVTTVPDDPIRYGPWAGKILAGAPHQGTIYAIDGYGNSTPFQLNIGVQDIHIVPARENFYGVDPVERRIWGAPATVFAPMAGDILVAQESPGALFRVRWNGASFDVSRIAETTAWAQVTFSPAGVAEIPPVSQDADRLAVVRHAPQLGNGRIEGALWQLLAEDVVLDGRDVVTSDLLVPGTPTVVTGRGHPAFGGVIDGVQNPLPDDYIVTIKGAASLRHLVTRTDPVELDDVATPPDPEGARDVTLNRASQRVHDFSTLRHLALTGGAGAVEVPPGTYGRFKATGRTAFVFGVENGTQRAVYNLEELSLGGGAELRLRGPVEITVARRVLVSGSAVAGSPTEPSRLLLRIAAARWRYDDDAREPEDDDRDGGCVVSDSDLDADREQERDEREGRGSARARDGADRPADDDSGRRWRGARVCGEGALYGIVHVPRGSIAITRRGRIRGTTMSDRLMVSGDGILQITENAVPPPPVNRPPTVDAGADQVITLPIDTVDLSGAASDDDLPYGQPLSFTWIAVDGPGPVSFADQNNPATTATFVEPGIYVLRLTASDSLLTGVDEMTVEVIPRNEPPAVDAGPDQTIDLPGGASLSGTVTDDGLPGGSTLTTTWSQVSGPDVVAFGDDSAPATTALFPAAGTYVLRLSASDAELTSNDEVTITVIAANQPPKVDAGVDQTISLLDAASLSGAITDDGLPAGSTLVASWTLVSGPGTVSFGNAGAAVTTATFSSPGSYVLRLSATDSQFSITDEVTITVNDLNQGPTVDAGANRTIVLPGVAQLNGAAADDGLPAGSSLSVSWSGVAGPGSVTFTNPNAPITTASFSATGMYLLRLTASDSQLTSTDDMIVAVDPANQPPAVDAGADQSITLPNGANLTGTAIDDGLPARSIVTTSWSVVSGPGIVTFDNPLAPATVARFSGPGTYVLRLTATDSEMAGQDDLTITVDVFRVNQPPAVAAGADQSVTLPGTASLNGTVGDDGLPAGGAVTVAWSQVSGPGTITFSDPAATQTEASFSAPGIYVLRLSASDSQLAGSDDVQVDVRTPLVDLAVDGVDTSGVATDPLTLVAGGLVQVDVRNLGTEPSESSFEVVLFEDSNRDRAYQSGVDALLGVEVFTGSIAANGVATLGVPMSGVVSFGSAAVHVFVDSAHQVVEPNETNNIGSSGLGSTFRPPPGDYAPKVKWAYLPSSPVIVVRGAPIVAPLVDTNDDGVVNERDIPAVVFVSGYAVSSTSVTAIRGDTGAVIFDTPAPSGTPFDTLTNPALGDLDGDGRPEIVVAECCRSVIHAFNSDGTARWTAPIVSLRSSPTIADLDADGRAEILYGTTIVNHDGTIRRSTRSPDYVGGNNQQAAGSQVADLDLDGVPEIITGPAAFDKDGNTLWFWRGEFNRAWSVRGTLDRGATTVTLNIDFNLHDGYTAVVNLDADPNPEIVVVSDQSAGGTGVCADSLWVFEHDGRLKTGFPVCLYLEVANQESYHLGPPTVADFDGDAQPEVAIPAQRITTSTTGGDAAASISRFMLAVYEANGQVVWQRELTPKFGISSPPAAAAFDFDGDGTWEVIFQDHQVLRIMEGPTGTSRYELGVGQLFGWAAYPVVADADNDGLADILVAAESNIAGTAPEGGVLAIADTRGNWRNARRVWNQWLYHVTNVGENSTIPPVQANNWLTFNNSRGQVSVDGADALAAPDLTLSRFTLDSQFCPASVGLIVRVGNAGSLHVGAGQRVRFYDGDPAAGGLFLGEGRTTRALWPGEFEDVTLMNVVAPFPTHVFAAVGETPTPVRVQSDNLARLPHTWAQASGYCLSCTAVANLFAYRGIDGASNTVWNYLAQTIPTDPLFYEVRFPFPVDAASVTIENNVGQAVTGFLTGTLEFSNGFRTPFALDANGQGTIDFPEQQNVSWVRLTGATTRAGGPSLSEFIVGGAYVEPQFRINESANRGDNNLTSSPAGLAPCDPSVQQPPFITSAPPIAAIAEAPYAYQVEAGDLNNDPLAFSLSVGPAGMTIGAAGSIAWIPSSAQLGSHPVTVQVSDGRGGVAEQSFTLRVRPPNQPPAVSAGPDLTITLNTPAVLNATATDDGLPAGSALTAMWSLVSGPGDATFISSTAVATSATFSAVGTYLLQLTVSDSQFTVSDEVTVSVDPIPPNQPPVVDAGPNQAVTQPSPLALFTNVSDDGLPVGGTLTRLWSHVSGPGTVTFTPGLANIVTASFSDPGTHVLRLVASDGELTGSDELAVSVIGAPVNQAPTVDAGPDRTINLPDSATLTGVVADDGLPGGATVTALWTPVSGPGTVTFGDASQAATTATFTEAGIYVLRLSATDTELGASADISIEVFEPITDPPPSVSLQSPADGSTITSKVDIAGTISGGSWRLEYALNSEDGSDSQSWTAIASGTGPTSGVLGSFDPTLLLNGVYGVRLISRDSAGQTTVAEMSAVVRGDQKVGRFSLAFIDLHVPVAGLSVQVVRSYDSRDKRRGDFGVGWTLAVRNVRLEKSGRIGKNWEQTRSGGFFPSYCLQPTRAQTVTITFPDGRVYQFQPVAVPECHAVIPVQLAVIGFRQMPGSPGTPGATLESLSGTDVIVSGTVPGPAELLDLTTLMPYNPTRFRLTTAEGDVYVLDQQTGVRSMTDRNGNTLTINGDGIIHSSGKSVTIARDTAGRVTAITDPAGRSMTYSYDAGGDLVSFTDRENNVTSFTYNGSHGLLTITDPRGIQPIRNEYDANGRLVRQIDAFGKEITYTHDLDTRQEIISDRLGNVTLHEYDASGNIVRTTDAEGGVTRYTYDARGNTLSVTNAAGKTTTYTYDALDNKTSEADPLGNTVSYAYNSRRQVLTMTDPRGGVTTNTYDVKGNLLSTTDALGNVTRHTYGANGLRAATTDALGNVTRYGRDTAGSVTTQINALGNGIAFTYDSAGNQVTQTATRTAPGGATETFVTTMGYDRLDRLQKITHADGSSREIVHNSAGKQTATKDPLGRETTHEYDAMGLLTRTSYPDGTSEQWTYDAEGRRLTSTDRAGRLTRYRYDKLGRPVETLFPDNTRTTTAYDAIGRRIASTDERGHTTTYEYDPNCGCANRQTRITDALGNVTSFTYDANGNQLTMTDAKGNATTYEYDANNRRTRIQFPDGTTAATSYDALGRSVATTDQAGNTTRFDYNEVGLLVKVTDALGQTTTFAYDEVGNRVSQTDANNRTTTFEYDPAGRRVRRVLPLGMAERLAYDAAGNVVSRTDFRGRTTTFAYDAENRLIGRTPDPSLGQAGVTYTYTATGQRASMVDGSGTTTYAYDSRNRLISKATTQGTLSYTYDAAGNLSSMASLNANGVSVQYGYDALNRLSFVTDDRLPAGANTTTYTYDANGNLSGYAYPNGVGTAYTYNSLNRLTDLGVSRTNTLVSYAYTLGPAGNRLAVTESSGRSVSYTYDALYRLTNETIAGAPAPLNNGTVDYTYDPVGNRLSRVSTLTNLPSANHAYDANDRLATDVSDANGSTTASGSNTYAYDFEDRLIDVNGGAVRFVYDGDGSRVAKIAGGVTTQYLVDTHNLTGYAQVVEELVAGSVQRVYTYGLDLISQRQPINGNWVTSFYGYDGHGSVRLLTDSAGNVTDTYTYDAFGSLIDRTGTTPNDYLYSGEQFDPNLGFYYLRARYLNPSTGRFWTMDTFEGSVFEPASLHKYAYTHSDPVNRADPSGQFSIVEMIAVVSILTILTSLAVIYGGLQKQGEARTEGFNALGWARTMALVAQADLVAMQTALVYGLPRTRAEPRAIAFFGAQHLSDAKINYDGILELLASGLIIFEYTPRDVPMGIEAECPPDDYEIDLNDQFFERPVYVPFPAVVVQQETQSFLLLHALARWAMHRRGLTNPGGWACGSPDYQRFSQTVHLGRYSVYGVRNPNSYAWFAISF
jgi:RHS repeat-associated protein